MDWKRVLAVAGGGAIFVAAVAAGAFAIVALAPGERMIASSDNPLLIERDPALKPFDAPAEPAPRQRVATLPDRPALDLAPTDPGGEASSPAEPPRQAAPPPRRVVPRPVAAVAPPVETPPPVARPIPAPVPALRPVERPPDGTLTRSEIRRIKLSLRLSREQEPYWAPVEQVLTEIGAQQAALARSGQNPGDAFGTAAAMRMFSAARPLLDVLREDQKAQVRERARAMGFGSIAASL